MKITVITGSPRKGGNTFAMVDAFVKAAETKGHDVVRFDAAMMKIGGCHGCMTCFRTGKACSFDDDFNVIAPHILEADSNSIRDNAYSGAVLHSNNQGIARREFRHRRQVHRRD